MSINKNWSRWIFASVSMHFDAQRQDIPLHIEGQPRDIKQDQTGWFELRLDGPYYTESSRKLWDIYVEVNVLILAAMLDTDTHRIRRLAGIVESAFTNISVFRYGDGIEDDKSYLGCLRLLQDNNNRVKTNHFGQVEPNLNQEQASVEGHYTMTLNE